MGKDLFFQKFERFEEVANFLKYINILGLALYTIISIYYKNCLC